MDKLRHGLTAALLLLTVVTEPLAASTLDDSSFRSVDAQPCSVNAPLPAAWSESEVWAWRKICAGQIADFDLRFDTPKDSDRQTANRFDEARRKLGAHFLRTVLTREPYRSAIPPEGVQISGASFDGNVVLRDAVLARVFGIFDSRFSGKFDMNRLQTSTTVAFSGSTFDSEFSMDSAVIGGNLNMEKGKYGEVVLKTAEIVGGITISGSTITGRLNMNGIAVGGDLFLNDATFSEVNLIGASVGRQLQTGGSTFDGTVEMANFSTGGHLLMNEGASFQDVVMRGAQIGGQLSMSEAVIGGKLDGRSMSVEQDLIMIDAKVEGLVELTMIRVADGVNLSGATLSGLNLNGATVGGQLLMRGSTLTGTLEMEGITTGGSLHMNQGSWYEDVVLRDARIGGHLDVRNAAIRGQFNGGQLSVGQDVVLTGAEFLHPLQLPMMRVAGSVLLGGTSLRGLDLYGATIKNDLALADFNGPTVQWPKDSDDKGRVLEPTFNLLNASVGTLVDYKNAWPGHVRLLLRDFRYERFLPLDGIWEGTYDPRPADWYIGWLAQDRTDSFQPYWQLATVLQSYGETAKANDILIAGREQERLQLPWWSPKRWGGWILRWLTGYGYGVRELQALWLALPFLLAGGELARRTTAPEHCGERVGYWYSLDMLLPVIWLREKHAQVDWNGCPKYYFQVHRFVGYVVLFFILAGLTGLIE